MDKTKPHISVLAFLISFFVFFAGICPYVCQAKEYQNQTSAHSCCPKNKTNQKNQPKKATDSCCNQHEQTVLNKQSIDFTINFCDQLLLAYIVEFRNQFAFQPATYFVIKERPPGTTAGQPLYIIKDSFLI